MALAGIKFLGAYLTGLWDAVCKTVVGRFNSDMPLFTWLLAPDLNYVIRLGAMADSLAAITPMEKSENGMV